MSDTTPMPFPRSITVTLSIDAQGAVSVAQAPPVAPRPAAVQVPFDSTYADRQGFSPAFLSDDATHAVQLPALSAKLSKASAKLIKQPRQDVLNYHGYSVVVHAKRRLALYSAANVDFGGRYALSRPSDVWRVDPRIDAAAQLTNDYYASNQFDRGHLTRREDMEYGPTRAAALASAADTCHWTNCTPQHARFNQNKDLWQGIERHLLEGAIQQDSFRAQVITGPVLADDDPTWSKFPKIQYPVRFWKVVAAVTDSGKLYATAYILDQSKVVADFGIEAKRAIPFPAFKTFQVPIADVEALTQLTFTGGPAKAPFSLSTVDPLAKGSKQRKALAKSRGKGAASKDQPEGWVALTSLTEVIRPA